MFDAFYVLLMWKKIYAIAVFFDGISISRRNSGRHCRTYNKTIFFRRIICTMGKMPDGSDENAYFIRSSETF